MVHSMVLKLGFNTTGTILFSRSQNGTNVVTLPGPPEELTVVFISLKHKPQKRHIERIEQNSKDCASE
jgi:molybdopterin-biosynthesis enzyme MoeA-like protein